MYFLSFFVYAFTFFLWINLISSRQHPKKHIPLSSLIPMAVTGAVAYTLTLFIISQLF